MDEINQFKKKYIFESASFQVKGIERLSLIQ